MAFNKKQLSGNIGVGGGISTLYVYSTEDDLATVSGAGYFNASADVLEANDIIQVDGLTFGLYRVVSNDGATVVVSASITEV